MKCSCHFASCALLLGTLLLGGIGARTVLADKAAPTPEEHGKATALVRQLGSRSFRTRQVAARQLMKMKLKARQAVEAGIKDKDPEVRRHCRELLPDLLRAELFARIAAFVADKDGKKDHALPGWKLFRELAGADAAARKLFAELSRREIDLFDALEKDPKRAGALCVERCERLVKGPANMRGMVLLPDDVLPLFLVTADPRASDANRPCNLQLCSLLDRPGLRQELTVKGPGSPFKKVVLGWMLRLTDDYALSQALDAAVRLGLPDCVVLAKKVVSGKKGGGGARAHALVVLGKADAKANRALFESLLEDKASVSGFGIGVANGPAIQGQTEVRDVALAMLVHLSGQKPADYGFAYTRSGNDFLFNAPFLGFSNGSEREAALKKWKAWKAAEKPGK